MPDFAPPRIAFDGSHLSPLAAEFARIRAMNDTLLLWRLCHKAACRRGRRCHGHACNCFAAKKRMVPAEVRAWYSEVAKAEGNGISFAPTSERGRVIASAANAWQCALWAAQLCEAQRQWRRYARRNGIRS